MLAVLVAVMLAVGVRLASRRGRHKRSQTGVRCNYKRRCPPARRVRSRSQLLQPASGLAAAPGGGVRGQRVDATGEGNGGGGTRVMRRWAKVEEVAK